MRRILGVSGGRMMSSLASPPLLMLPPWIDVSGNVVFNFHGVSGDDMTVKKRIDIESSGLAVSDDNEMNELEFVGSSHGWLAVYNRLKHDVFLSNPMSDGRMIKLPPPPTMPCVENHPLTGGVSRLKMSCSPDEDECRAMMISGEEGRLSVCVTGGSTEWTPLGQSIDVCRRGWFDCPLGLEHSSFHSTAMDYEDVVYSSKHKLFFCVTRLARVLEGWSVVDPLSPTLKWKVQFEFPEWSLKLSNYRWQCWDLKYLVFAEESDDLFLVVRHVNPRSRRDGSFDDLHIYYSRLTGFDYSFPYKTVGFDVYKIDRKAGQLRFMDHDLDGLAIFIGINDSYAVAASEYSELNPNSIYFSDEHRLMRRSRSHMHRNYGGHDNGIYNYVTDTFSSCCGTDCPLDRNPNVVRINHPPLWFASSTNFSSKQ